MCPIGLALEYVIVLEDVFFCKKQRMNNEYPLLRKQLLMKYPQICQTPGPLRIKLCVVPCACGRKIQREIKELFTLNTA